MTSRAIGPPRSVRAAALPAQVIAILSALVFALNFCLEMLTIYGPGRNQQILLSALLICLAVWAVVEVVLLQSRHRVRHIRRLTVLLIVQVAVEVGRLVLVFTGPTSQIDQAYGVGQIDVGISAVLLSTYVVVFLGICQALMKSQLAELGDAYGALQRSNAKLEELATTDALTGAVNRRHFDDNAATAITDSRRRASALSLLLLDVDNFKAVNDRHGHLTGDRVLAELARMVTQSVRPSDSVSRWGGEEFAVLMPDADVRAAELAAERLRTAITGHEFESAGHVTVSVGIAQHLRDERFSEWMARADAALYEAKRRGRDTVVVAGDERPQRDPS